MLRTLCQIRTDACPLENKSLSALFHDGLTWRCDLPLSLGEFKIYTARSYVGSRKKRWPGREHPNGVVQYPLCPRRNVTIAFLLPCTPCPRGDTRGIRSRMALMFLRIADVELPIFCVVGDAFAPIAECVLSHTTMFASFFRARSRGVGTH